MIYLLCTLTRSGSTWLASTLANTGMVGHPAEWTNPNYLMQFGIREQGMPLRLERVRELIEQHQVNGWWGAKITANTYHGLVTSGKLEELFPERPKYMYLKRENHVSQAISQVMAYETGRYFQNQRFPTGRKPVELAYKRERVETQIRQCEGFERMWERYFERMGVDPLRLTYEELCADMRGSVVRVLEFLGVNAPENLVVSSGMAKQANAVNAEWERRFRG